MPATIGYVTKIDIEAKTAYFMVRYELPLGMFDRFILWDYSSTAPSLDDRYRDLSRLSLVRDAMIHEIPIRIEHNSTSSSIIKLSISTDINVFGPFLAAVERVLEPYPSLPEVP